MPHHEAGAIRRTEGDDVSKVDPKQELLAQARERYSGFGSRFEKTVNGYFGTPDIQFTCKPGGWYIDLEKLVVNADPEFFLEKGYSEAEALFATFHEAEHFHDLSIDSEAYTVLFRRLKQRTEVSSAFPKAVMRLYNCIDDILVNNAVMSKWKQGRIAKDALYPKLFPYADLAVHPTTGKPVPRHRQFMYALLRRAMLPNEPVTIDDDVQAAIQRAEDRGKGKPTRTDLVTAVDMEGKARLTPSERFALMRQYYEKEFEELYRQDMQDRKSDPEKGRPGEGKGGGEFGDDPFEDAIPDPMDMDKVLDQVDKIKKAAKAKKNANFVQQMGVEKKDFEAYQRDFERVRPVITELSKIFDDIIERRKSKRRQLRKSVKEGIALDPRKAATAVAEIKSGNFEPQVMLDYEYQEVIQNEPSEIEFTLICDGTGSMKDGTKDVMQRRLAVLAMEAFSDFRERVEKARRNGENIELQIKSEVRIFDSEDHPVKPLDISLTHPERVQMHKALSDLPGGGNNEVATLDAIESEQFRADRLRKLHDGSLKKIILLLTDGGAGDPGGVKASIRKLEQQASGSSREKSSLVIAGIGFGQGEEAKTLYAPNGYYATNIEDMPKIFKEFLSKILEDL